MNPIPQTESYATVQAPTLSADPPQVTTLETVKESLPLALPTPDFKPKKAAKAVDAKLDALADNWLKQLLAAKPEDLDKIRASRNAVESLGKEESTKMVKANALLSDPLNRLMAVGSEGGQVAKDLANLKVEFDKLNPNQIKFRSGPGAFFISLVSWIPGVGTPLNRYFTRFQSSGNVINDIFHSLELGKETLERDIEILQDDQQTMRALSLRVGKLIEVGQLVGEKLEQKITDESDTETKRFMKEELQFPLLQRLTDLQQQLIVNQQGIVTFEVLVRNNRELIRGVARCETVTRPALRIGVMAAMALNNQRIVLKGIQDLNKVAEGFIDFNSRMLESQGAQIQKDASTAQLDDAVLARAVQTAVKALDDVSNFRINAIEQMKAAIGARQDQIAQAEAAIVRMEKGNNARPTITLELPKAA